MVRRVAVAGVHRRRQPATGSQWTLSPAIVARRKGLPGSSASEFHNITPDNIASLLTAILAGLLRWKLLAEQIDVLLNLLQALICNIPDRNEVVPLPALSGSFKKVLKNLCDLQTLQFPVSHKRDFRQSEAAMGTRT